MAQVKTPDQFYPIVLANLPVGYSRVDPEGIIVEFNKAAEKITGYSKDDVLGKAHLTILHGAAARVCPLLDTLSEQKERIATEAAIITRGGEIVNLSVTSFPLFDEDGLFLGGVEIFRDVTALKRMERERKNLLSMFVHDMKSPIVSALGFLHRILAGKNGSLTEKQEKHLHYLQTILETVENLTKDFLDYSHYETKEYKPQLELLDIAALIDEQAAEARIKADQKDIAFSYDGPQHLLVEADAAMLARMISNLLDNAIRYTTPQGSVVVRLGEQDEQLLLQVEDTGIGIPEEQLPFVFDAFHRVSRDTKGSGLGLAVVKLIVEAHHGKIWVTSIRGKGTTFSLVLPKKQHGSN